MAELINKTDTLNEGREKLNAAITDAEKAKVDAGQAVNTSNQAKQIAQTAEHKADSVQAQFDQVIIEGDSSVEAAAARVDEKNETHPTLKARIDDGFEKTTAQLADIGINVKALGSLKGDGTEDILPYINLAFEKSNNVYVPRDGAYLLSGELEIPEGKTIDFSKSLIKYIDAESRINISPNTIVKNYRFQVPGNLKLNKAAIYFDGNKKFNFGHNTRTFYENIYGEQQNGEFAYENDFIHFDATQKGDSDSVISGTIGSNISSMRFKHGIRNTVNKTGAGACYITGNIINNYIAYNPMRFIWDDDVNGGEIAGNTYSNVECQPADGQEKTFLRLVGNGNSVSSAQFWDVSRPSNQEGQIILIGNSNYLQGNIPTFSSPYVSNTGRHNVVIGGYPGKPSMLINSVTVETDITKIYKGSQRQIPFLSSRTQTKVDSTNNVRISLFSETFPNNELGNYTTVRVKSFGTCETPHTSTFGMEVNDTYLQAQKLTNSYINAFALDGLFVIRKTSSQIIVKGMIKVFDYVLVGEKTYELNEDIKLEIYARNEGANKITMQYSDSEIIK